jgi:ribose transport system substrate-binding protein
MNRMLLMTSEALLAVASLLGAINSAAIAEAEKTKDIEVVAAHANLQISHVERFIDGKFYVMIVLPTDGAPLTDVATRHWSQASP